MHDIRSRLCGGERLPVVTKQSVAQSGHAKRLGFAGIQIRREETRRGNERREDRHVNLAERAVVTFRRRNHEVAIVNVSSSGALIQSEIEPRIGERVHIRFEDCNRTRCSVRWIRDGRIGLEFDDETVIIGPAHLQALVVAGRRAGEQPAVVALKQARPPRHHLIWSGTLHSKSASAPVRLRNISADGAMLEGSEDLFPNTAVVLELTGANAINGRVRWCRGGQIGIRFDDKFDLASLAHCEPSVTSARMVKPDYLQSEMSSDSPWAARHERLRPQDFDTY